ncbi:MarR family transcriptional regulator [Maritimibacter sp. UBA3975]|uniref:GbsR/MarR family transcriptional regulator n=1 Tax=Maritimibacter sp. UBA3975 TaxID=1946833 RepID=UPI000C09356A|nr:MarR family transcriptional regulator [Maritimibacter sp. UBA3975]MAM59900.1 transcriptional regulator [Maritimibacter sp.]|tara:strand:+ start:21047 stop:21511 length:465 start_codon:yes stop_codon:yes gene_type:complete
MNRDPIEQFIEQMGFMTQDDGLPRIAGQVLGYLLIEGEPRTLAEISEALSVSKASASTNCRQLADKGILTRANTRGSRADSYMAVTNPAEDMLAGMAARYRARARAIEDAATGFPDSHAEARARVTAFARFFRTSADFLEEWTERAQRQMADSE